MDRRKKRTSTNQYMMYINMMEKDPIFATGRIPRNVDVNYLHKKWKELSDKLNTCSTGPSLTAEEWRKRLNDWKNTTRCKYRRSLCGEKDITLTSLEQQALELFGKVPNNTSSGELSIHLKSEKDEDDEDDDEMEHQRTSDTLQKELQAAVEEAIGGDDNEEIMEDSHDEQEELLHDPLTANANNTLGTLSTLTNNGGGNVSNEHHGGINNTTTYRTIVMENAHFTDEDNNDEHLELIPHRRVATLNNCVTTGVQTLISNNNNIGTPTTTTKLINGELPVKRLRTQANEQIIYEVKKTGRPMATMVSGTPIITSAQTITPQSHYQQQDINPGGGSTTTYHLTGTNTSITASNSANMGMTSQDARDIARQLKRVADIKAEKLKFEIARFKFNNPGFDFNSPLL